MDGVKLPEVMCKDLDCQEQLELEAQISQPGSEVQETRSNKMIPKKAK